MSCFHPKLMYPTGKVHSKTGKPIYEFVKDAGSRNFVSAKDDGCVIIPCGKCLGCRLDYSRSWADRMMLELEIAHKAIFVTLTYDNDHVPILEDDDTGELIGFTLDKRDCQLFLKNLRRDYDGKDGHPLARIRFYLVGEYGEHTQRPHYHAIVFGLDINDFPLRIPHGRNELGQMYYEVPELKKCWPHGFILASEVSWNTCAYVSRYVMKKAFQNGLDAFEKGLEKEFVLMSRRPGIGREYLDEHPGCLEFESINISTAKGGKKIRIPRYYLKQMELKDPEKYAIIKEQRKEMANDAMLQKLARTSLSYLEQLEVEESDLIRRTSALKRQSI